MPKKLTQEEFVQRSKTVHGDRYGYEKAEYKGNHTNVMLHCNIHGYFEQSPAHHMNGRGCNECSYEYRSQKTAHTVEKFVEKARAVHGNRYDYSLVEYKNSATKVQIKCSEHGTFWKTPDSHTGNQKQGCPECAKECNLKRIRERVKPFNQFKDEMFEVYGDTYDVSYASNEYTDSRSAITLHCDIHAIDFKKSPYELLRGNHCPKCGKARAGEKGRSNTEGFIRKSQERFPQRLDYSEVNYERSNIKVSLICKKHNLRLSITPNLHLHPLSAGGCPECAKELLSLRFKKTTEDWVEEAIAVHGDKYDYTNSFYTGSQDNIEIRCRVEGHGDFWQSSSDHIHRKIGCPKCAEHGYRQTNQGTLYVLSNGELTKLGITNTNGSTRCYFLNRMTEKNFRVIYEWKWVDGRVAYNLEDQLLKQLRQNFEQPKEKFNGYTECFYDLDPEYLKQLIENKTTELPVNLLTKQ